MYSIELHQVTVKKSPENATSAFYDALYAKNWAKIRENPYFSQKSRYLKTTFFYLKMPQIMPIFSLVLPIFGAKKGKIEKMTQNVR